MNTQEVFDGLREFYGQDVFQYFQRDDGSLEAYFESTPLFSELYLQISKDFPIKQRFLMTEIIEDKPNFIKYRITYLPRIFLEIKVYPNMPDKIRFSLHSVWLNDDQISEILDQATAYCQDESLESPITHFLAFLDHDLLSSVFPDFETTETISFNEPSSINMRIVDYILEYNEENLRKVIPDKVYECLVCCEHMRGSKCFRFNSCGHLFCRKCIRSFFESSIANGIVENTLTCLECHADIPEFEIRAILSKAAFKKYDETLLSRALKLMPDIVECPRPNCRKNATIISQNVAKCAYCNFTFCPKCKRLNHASTYCSAIEPKDEEDIIKAMEGDDEELKKDLAEKFGEKELERIMNEHQSKKYLADHSQQCPNCSAHVQRAYGCSVMQCFFCNQVFCWLCLAKLDPLTKYQHFQTSDTCRNRLFDANPIDEDQNEAYEIDDDE